MAVKAIAEQEAADGQQLSDKDVVALRTAPATGPTDRFEKIYVVQTTGLNSETDDNDSMHEANKVAVLNEALNRGLHPTGPAKFQSREDDGRGSTLFTYTVPVVPAARHEVVAEAYTPTKALNDLGGTTIVDSDDADTDRKIRDRR